jgi:hypothetical protein
MTTDWILEAGGEWTVYPSCWEALEHAHGLDDIWRLGLVIHEGRLNAADIAWIADGRRPAMMPDGRDIPERFRVELERATKDVIGELD